MSGRYLFESPAGTAIERDGARIRTDRGWYVDVSGGQHALLFSKPVAYRRIELTPDDLVGINRYIRSAHAAELADWIAEYDESPGLHSYLVSGGTEAFEASLAIAQHVAKEVHGRDPGLVVGLSESYHGSSIAALNAGDHPVHRNRVSGAWHLSWPKIDRTELCTGEAATNALTKIFCANNVTAVVIEAIGGTTSGAHELPADALLAIRDVCRRHGVALIVDEIITGFGRTGSPFCVRNDDFDIRLSGKLLGGGLVPICAVSLSPHYSALVRTCASRLYLRYTYSGNAFAAKTALMLQKLRSENGSLDVLSKGIRLRSALEERLGPLGVRVRGRGLLLSAILLSDRPSETLREIVGAAHKMQVLVMGGASSTQKSAHVMITPALDSSSLDLEITVDAVHRLFQAVTAKAT